MLFRSLDLSIDKQERLTCPLSSCKKSFGDQQYLELVHHVSSCPYLERGVYDCPYCRKEESFCWELPYTIDSGSEEEDGSSPGSVPFIVADDASSPVRADTTPIMNVNHHHSNAETDQSHLFGNQYAEFERETFPEVFVSTEGRPSRSPAQGMVEPHKRKYSEFDEGTIESSSFAEFSTDTLPQTTAGYSPYTHYMPAMTFELPSSNVAGHSSAHLSARTSPEAMQRSPQLMHRAMEMNLDPFQMGVSVSPGFAGPGHIPCQLPQARAVTPTASPEVRSRQLSNASTVVRSQHSQHSPQSQLDPSGVMGELVGGPRSRRGSSRTSDISGRQGSTTALPGEAEKSSLQCKECGKIFTGKAAWLPSNLQRHMRETHLNAPKTKCRICGKDFNRGHNLRHHMKAVHGEQP